MKLRLASVSLFVSVALLCAGVTAQTTKRSTKSKSRTQTAGTPSGATLKICQGVPIPPGYVVTAYLTSSTCPHGMYILKKQDQYSESLAISKGADRQPAKPASASPTNSASTAPAGPAKRPRRVGTSQPPNSVTSLSADEEVEPFTRPPTWAVAPTGAPAAVSDNAVVDPGPEEVSEGDVIKIDTSLVTVPVSVLDRHGRFIPDLKREDFTVFENGTEQSIAYFEPADKPFTVALLLDTSPSTQFHLWEIKEAAIAFAKQLRPQDKVLVVSFNDQVLLLTEVTNDLNVIQSVIVQNANMGHATRLYDAVELVINERLNKIKGRKAMVLFTDGVDTASYLATYESNIREVEELDALIYPIKYDTTDYLRAMQGGGNVTVVTTSTGPFGTQTTSRVTYGTSGTTNPNAQPLPGATKEDYDRADLFLHELADKTAGRLYKANTATELANAFSQIAEELRRQYSLGYYPQAGAGVNSERRQIKVRVKRPNLAVKARDSYVRSAPSAPTAPASPSQ